MSNRSTSASTSDASAGFAEHATANRVAFFFARSTAVRAEMKASPVDSRMPRPSGSRTVPMPMPTLHRPERVRASAMSRAARPVSTSTWISSPAVRSAASARWSAKRPLTNSIASPAASAVLRLSIWSAVITITIRPITPTGLIPSKSTLQC
jgi:hypothetical protein